MLRIIRFEIDFDALVDASDASRSTVERLQDLVELTSSNDVFYTPAMSTASALYFDIEACLRTLFGDGGSIVASAEEREIAGKWVVVDYSDIYSLIRTRAPKDYDYAYCVDVGRVDGMSSEERLVAMPKDRVTYQSGRYGSGMFSAVDCG
jgi:hypothetical protein